LGQALNKERIGFYGRLYHSSEAIPRNAEGFDDFLKEFPPLAENPADVSAIAARLLSVDNTGNDVWSTVRYVVHGQTAKAIATQSDIRDWTFKTSGTKLGLLVAFFGFLISTNEYRHSKPSDTSKTPSESAPKKGP
jgi:hypothetical protein